MLASYNAVGVNNQNIFFYTSKRKRKNSLPISSQLNENPRKNPNFTKQNSKFSLEQQTHEVLSPPKREKTSKKRKKSNGHSLKYLPKQEKIHKKGGKKLKLANNKIIRDKKKS